MLLQSEFLIEISNIKCIGMSTFACGVNDISLMCFARFLYTWPIRALYILYGYTWGCIYSYIIRRDQGGYEVAVHRHPTTKHRPRTADMVYYFFFFANSLQQQHFRNHVQYTRSKTIQADIFVECTELCSARLYSYYIYTNTRTQYIYYIHMTHM